MTKRLLGFRFDNRAFVMSIALSFCYWVQNSIMFALKITCSSAGSGGTSKKLSFRRANYQSLRKIEKQWAEYKSFQEG